MIHIFGMVYDIWGLNKELAKSKVYMSYLQTVNENSFYINIM